MIPQVELKKVLSEAPYVRPEGVPLGTPVKMRKSKLRGNFPRSPFKNVVIEQYGSGPLSQYCIKRKIELDKTTGRCYAVAGFLSPNSKNVRFTEGVTEGPPGGPHAELKALAQLPPGLDKENVRIVYIERKCCELCHAKLKELLHPDTTIVYSCHYTPDAKRQRKNEAAFRVVQANLGVRDSTRKVLFPS